MTGVQKFGGTWKLFENESLYQGELHINHDKRIVALELLIPASENNPMPRPPYKGKIPYISGTLFSGAKILLYQCITGKEHNRVMSYTQQIIHAAYAFWGLEVKSKDEIQFTNVIFDFGNIVRWSGLCRYDWKFNDNGSANLIWIQKQPVSFKLNDDTCVTFHPCQGPVGGEMYEKEIRARQSILAEFKYERPMKFDSIMEDALYIQYLIGLGIGNKVGIDGIEYKHSSIYTEILEDETLKKLYRPAGITIGTGNKDVTPDVGLYDYLYTLDDLGKKDIFFKWNKHYPKLKPILDLYFAAFSRSTGTPEMLFLNLTQALETYHARFVTDDIKEYKDIIEKNMDFLREGGTISKDWKNFMLDDAQKGSKRIFLRSRLAYLIFANGVVPFWPSNYDSREYVKKVVDTRNYYTHYNPKDADKAFPQNKLSLVNTHLSQVQNVGVNSSSGISLLQATCSCSSLACAQAKLELFFSNR